jgi:uncharacterized membrane protein YkvA (DUF1232 family)
MLFRKASITKAVPFQLKTKDVNRVSTNQDLILEKKKFDLKAKEYLDDPKKTDGLLMKAISKANDKKNTLSQVWEKLQLLFELVKAYSKGEYRKISTSSLLTVIGAIIYFVSPIDFVPDFIAGLGIIDDAAVIAFTFKQISTDLEKFKQWKDTRKDEMQIPLE